MFFFSILWMPVRLSTKYMCWRSYLVDNLVKDNFGSLTLDDRYLQILPALERYMTGFESIQFPIATRQARNSSFSLVS